MLSHQSVCGPDACEVGQYKDPEGCCKGCDDLCDPGRGQEEECLWSCGPDFLKPDIPEPSQLISSSAHAPVESDDMFNNLAMIIICVAGATFLGIVLIIGYIVLRSRTRRTDQENVMEEEEEEEVPLKKSVEETEQPNPWALRAQAPVHNNQRVPGTLLEDCSSPSFTGSNVT